MPPEKRRRIVRLSVAMYVPIVTIAIVLVIHPWGVRHTLTYLVILPFVVIVPVATIIVGVRAARRARR